MEASARITANRRFVELTYDEQATSTTVMLNPEEASDLAAEIIDALCDARPTHEEEV